MSLEVFFLSTSGCLQQPPSSDYLHDIFSVLWLGNGMMFRVNAPFWFGHWWGGLIFRRERQEYVGRVSHSFMDECGPLHLFLRSSGVIS